MTKRIYTADDAAVQDAIHAGERAGLYGPGASLPRKLRTLILHAGEHLAEEEQRTQLLDAYRMVAGDDERLATIEASNLRSAEVGLL